MWEIAREAVWGKILVIYVSLSLSLTNVNDILTPNRQPSNYLSLGSSTSNTARREIDFVWILLDRLCVCLYALILLNLKVGANLFGTQIKWLHIRCCWSHSRCVIDITTLTLYISHFFSVGLYEMKLVWIYDGNF